MNLSIGVLPSGPGLNVMLALFRAVSGTDTNVITGWKGSSGKKYQTILKSILRLSYQILMLLQAGKVVLE